MRFRAADDWDRQSKDALRERQFARLRAYLRTQVLPFSPYYQKLFREHGLTANSLKSLDDVRRLPFTVKSDIVPNEKNPDGPRAFILQPTKELIRSEMHGTDLLRIALKKLFLGTARFTEEMVREYTPTTILFTTGRSASSLPFFLSAYDMDILRTTGKRIDDVLGLSPQKDKIVSIFPYAPHLAFWQVHECGQAGHLMTLSTGGGRVMGADRIIDIVKRIRPTLVCGMPGYFYHVLRYAREKGVVFDSIEKVALGGENVPPELKSRIVEMLREMGAKNPKVASVFGFTEARQCWTECLGAENTGFHTSPDLALFEIVDPKTGEVLPDDTTGELVYTTLDGRGSPLLRYRTGDIVEGGMTHDACPGCGRTVPRVRSMVRRVSNVKELDISKVKGTLINLNSVSELIQSRKEVEEWQIVIAKANDDPLEIDVMRLYCALKPGADAAAFGDAIQHEMVLQNEVRFNDVIVTTLDDMLARVGMETNTKEERIIDRRPKASVRTEAPSHARR